MIPTPKEPRDPMPLPPREDKPAPASIQELHDLQAADWQAILKMIPADPARRGRVFG